MSRIGKNPVQVPSGVKIALDGSTLKVNGTLGSLELEIKPEINLEVKGSEIEFTRANDGRSARSLHGLTRSLVYNMVKGVSDGFEKKLDIIGVGYKADVQGSVVNLALGYSHPIKYELPKGVTATVEKQTMVTIKGPDKQVVGQVAADIRSMRPPEPYKGKGIKYSDEVIRRKAGKAGKAGGK
ncbi:MAG: 50S ribosomal protein L6 [Deltaproteobacteria bacterium RBG_19FT_COMBO_58_16]|nr:MAG: 50S ribosomal protein L6 [Deltaproteobacteria bacterium RBG_19FT_COMBO_58_16]